MSQHCSMLRCGPHDNTVALAHIEKGHHQSDWFRAIRRWYFGRVVHERSGAGDACVPTGVVACHCTMFYCSLPGDTAGPNYLKRTLPFTDAIKCRDWARRMVFPVLLQKCSIILEQDRCASALSCEHTVSHIACVCLESPRYHRDRCLTPLPCRNRVQAPAAPAAPAAMRSSSLSSEPPFLVTSIAW